MSFSSSSSSSTGEVLVTYIPAQDALVHQESAMIQLKKETEPDTSESEREDEEEDEGKTFKFGDIRNF